MTSLNQRLLFARYAGSISICLRAALLLQVVARHNKGNTLSAEELATLLGINPIAGRSFFNVLTAIGILKWELAGYSVHEDAHALLSEGHTLTLAAYLSIGLEGDPGVTEFVQFLKDPSNGSRLYAEGGETSLMDQPNGISTQVAYGLASRARRFAPSLATLVANRLGEDASVLDLGAGSPHVAIALLKAQPKCRVTLGDRGNATRFIFQMAKQEQLTVQDSSENLTAGQVGILECNMFNRETLPRTDAMDAVILSNVLHDWAPPQIVKIVGSAISCLKPNGILVIHEGFLSLDPSNPNALWFAAYGMTLNQLTAGQGSCYLVEEYDRLLQPLGVVRGNFLDAAVQTVDGCRALFYQLRN